MAECCVDQPPLICWDPLCIFDQRYRPDEHTIRYCSECQTWAHVECCGGPTDKLSNGEPYTDAIFDGTMHSKAREMFMCPIVQSGWYREKYWGLEIIILNARYAVGKSPGFFRKSDWHDGWSADMLQFLLEDTFRSGLSKERLIADFDQAVDVYIAKHSQDVKLRCSGCGLWI